ncbi:MAG TPA: response regulator [Dehalococcoidia bacterium]|jgi:excisionase family DNA binding protein|nr:response regulator [Dehalococcoidia bacterium]
MPQLMTVEELGRYLRFTKRTIYRLLKQGSIPAIKIGNKWRFDREAIDKWLRHGMEEVKGRILVIDDDELIRSLFKETLEGQGHTVITAGTGAEGIECVKRWDFDLVFLDLKLPETDGAELLKQMRSAKPELPVTIITGYPGSEMMERALKQGPFGVMNKPFDASDIITAVNSFLQARRARR